MSNTDSTIHNVSDTSLWVAYYRAKETERSDALFRDPLAKVLSGERGRQIAESMKSAARFTEWSVITRTVIIDNFVKMLIDEGIDTVLNLGAGLDTRPYRMKLPKTLKWIEVDYPQIIDLKNNLLKAEIPGCQLSRVAIDLGDDESRRKFLAKVGAESKKVLVITEGVIPYLSPDQVTALATDLRSQPSFYAWTMEWFDAKVYRYMKSNLRTQKMKKNAPFRFYPDNWIGFFDKLDWIQSEIRYLGVESQRLKRPMPMPWWAKIFMLIPSKAREQSRRMSGYILFKRRL